MNFEQVEEKRLLGRKPRFLLFLSRIILFCVDEERRRGKEERTQRKGKARRISPIIINAELAKEEKEGLGEKGKGGRRD